MRSSWESCLNTLLSQTSSKASKPTTRARIVGSRLYSSSTSTSTCTSVSRYQPRLASTLSTSHSNKVLNYSHQLTTHRQDRSSYSTDASSSSGSLAKVPHRSIIEFKGRDTLKLLQGLISNDVRIFEKGIKDEQDGSKGLYAVFLHPNGRMVADVYLYQHPSPSESSTPSTSSAHLLLECDSRALPSLSAFIKKFKLRSKVSIKDVTQDWQVYQIWGDEHQEHDTSSSLKDDLELKGNDGDGLVVIRDVRSPAMGRRVLIPSGNELTSQTHTATSSDSYTAHRIMQGVPEGPLDFVESSSLPLEMSCDYMNGIDFRKGCYVGQELTARTHHTGVVRKRVVPIVFYKEGESAPTSLSYSPEFSHELPPPGTEIRSFPISSSSSSTSESTSSPKKPTRGKAAGKFSSGIGNVGLACLRLEQVKRWSDPSSSSNVENGLGMSLQSEEGKTLLVRPFLPSWWPEEIEEEGVREERGDQYGEGVSE